MASYRERVLRDLRAWEQAGWVSRTGAAAIASSLPKPGFSFSFATIMGLLGAVLVGAGILAFVAANWEAIPRFGRFALTLGLMALAYVTAWRLQRRSLTGFVEAALLIAGLALAATFVLIGQIYHLAENFGGLIISWVVGVYAAGLVLRSPVMTALGLIGGAVWTITTMGAAGPWPAPHWIGFAPALAGGAIAVWLGSHYAGVLSIIALLLWATANIVIVSAINDWNLAEVSSVLVVAALAAFTLATLLASFGEKTRVGAFGRLALWPTLTATLVAFGVVQLADEPIGREIAVLVALVATFGTALALGAIAAIRQGMGATAFAAMLVLGTGVVLFVLFVPAQPFVAKVIGAALVLSATVWAVHLGHTGQVPAATPTGLAAFGAEVLYVYVETLGTILDTSVVFLTGGLLFIILAFVLYRIDRWLAPREAAP